MGLGNPAQKIKYLNTLPPVIIKDNTAWVTTEIDTLGYDYATVIFCLGATDIAVAVLKVQESDTSGSGFADITGADFDGDTDIDGAASTLPTATDDDGVFVVQLDLKSRKRYLDLSATAGDGTVGSYASAVTLLSRAGESPSTSAEAGAANILRV